MKQYCALVDKNAKSRLGCSVCSKKTSNDNSNVKSSFYKTNVENKVLEKNVTYKKHKEINGKSKRTPDFIDKPKINECYCNHMEPIKKEPFPKLICSKRFKTLDLVDIDEDWLHEIKEFRRENWFDCHADSLININSVKNNRPCIFSNHSLNYNYLNDSMSLNSSDELKIGNLNITIESQLPSSKHIYKEKTISQQKPAGKKKLSIISRPWLPPSAYCLTQNYH